MKKLMAILIIILCLSFPFYGIADSITEQLSQYTIEDLNELYIAVEEELAKREASDGIKILSGGCYVVGRDLPAGTYEFTLYKTMLSTSSIPIHASMEDYRAENYFDLIQWIGLGSKYRITIEEGNVLEINSTSAFYVKKVNSSIFQ